MRNVDDWGVLADERHTHNSKCLCVADALGILKVCAAEEEDRHRLLWEDEDVLGRALTHTRIK